MSNKSDCAGVATFTTTTTFTQFQEYEAILGPELPTSHVVSPALFTGCSDFAASVHLALAIVTFYRKSFTFSSHGLLCLFSGLASLLPLLPAHSLLLHPILTLASLHQLLQHRKSLDSQDLFNFSSMLLLLHLLPHLPDSPQLPWLLPLLLSPLQLIRKPAFLLRTLRPLRVAAGPVSIILTIVVAFGQIKQDLVAFQGLASPTSVFLLLSTLHALSVIILAVIAGIVFRPDNMSVMDLLAKGKLSGLTNSLSTSYSNRVETHAFANALVLLLCLGKLAACCLLC